MTPEEQWLEINYSRGFLIAVLDRVKAVRDALLVQQATADEIRTNVNGVALTYRETGEPGVDNTGTGWVHIQIGTTSSVPLPVQCDEIQFTSKISTTPSWLASPKGPAWSQ